MLACFLTYRCDLCDQDVHANTLVKSPWPLYPSLSVLSSSRGGNRGQIRCSSSVWKRSSPSENLSGMYQLVVLMERGGCKLSSLDRTWLTWGRNVPHDSGKAQPIEELWEEYFADPFQWWDNRIDKVPPKTACQLMIDSWLVITQVGRIFLAWTRLLLLSQHKYCL